MKMYTSLWNKMTHTRRWKRLTKKWMHGLHYFHTRSNNDMYFLFQTKKTMLAMAAQRWLFFFKKKEKERKKKDWSESVARVVGHICWYTHTLFLFLVRFHYCKYDIYICTLQFRHILYTSQSINIWNVEIIRSDYIQITISKYIISQYINTHTYLEPYTYEVTFHYVKSDLVRDNVVTPMVSPLDTMRGKNTN